MASRRVRSFRPSKYQQPMSPAKTQSVPVRLGGTMAEPDERGLVLTGHIEGFPPVRLAFAWSQSNRTPVILGQTNFFLEFDVRFCRSHMFFEIALRSRLGS